MTSQNTSDKIQKTIDKFVSGERHKKFDRLFFVLLKDKEDYNKNFTTNDAFEFDKDRDIFDLNDLIAEVQKLDTAVLKKINVYISEELGKKRDYPKISLACVINWFWQYLQLRQ